MNLEPSRSFLLVSFRNYARLKLILVFDGGHFLQFFIFFVDKTNNETNYQLIQKNSRLWKKYFFHPQFETTCKFLAGFVLRLCLFEDNFTFIWKFIYFYFWLLLLICPVMWFFFQLDRRNRKKSFFALKFWTKFSEKVVPVHRWPLFLNIWSYRYWWAFLGLTWANSELKKTKPAHMG